MTEEKRKPNVTGRRCGREYSPDVNRKEDSMSGSENRHFVKIGKSDTIISVQ